MIISHEYKYIFLKTAKTAGTSIEISLSRFCAQEDIITPISKKDEEIRKDLGIYNRNYIYTRFLEFNEYNLRDLQRLFCELKQPQITTKFYNHISANQIKQALGTKIWNSYFKFCFVRNPWDRAISKYYWKQAKNAEIKSLDLWLTRANLNLNWEIYTIDNEVAVDYIGKYESLTKDLSCVAKKLSIPFDNWLPRAKDNFRKNRRHYSEILTAKQAKIIEEKCINEIKLFGYKFR